MRTLDSTKTFGLAIGFFGDLFAGLFQGGFHFFPVCLVDSEVGLFLYCFLEHPDLRLQVIESFCNGSFGHSMVSILLFRTFPHRPDLIPQNGGGFEAYLAYTCISL